MSHVSANNTVLPLVLTFYLNRLRHTSNTVWHKIFAGSNFCDFPAIRKNKFPQIKITANIFPAKIYSGLNILHFLNLHM